jgi:hypothetical protein
MTARLTGRQQAIAFHRALTRTLSNELDFPAGFAAERLARGFHGGVVGMLEWLEREMKFGDTYDYAHLNDHLLVVWVTPDDQRDLRLTTGLDREGWLAL